MVRNVSSATWTAVAAKPAWRFGMVAALVVLSLAVVWRRAPIQDLRNFDQNFYQGIAYDLRHTGRFTDGTVYGTPGPDGTRPSAMRFAPLYPAALAVAAMLDPSFDRALSCEVEQPAGFPCPRTASLVRTVQFVLLCGFYLLLWWIAGTASGSRRIGAVALIVGLFTAPMLVGFVNYLMTEMATLFLVTAATAAALKATMGVRSGAWLTLAGALLGLTALTRPAFEYLFLASVAAGVGLALLHRDRRQGIRLALGFAIGGGLVMLPWIVRNELVLSRPALTFGYASEVLVQRIAFDQMSWGEFGRSFICWLPDGRGMGTLLWGPDACEPFQLEMRPDTFYGIGNTTLLTSTVAAAGGLDHHLGYLLRHYIAPHIPWHVMVSIPLALNGIKIDHYWGFVLTFVCAAVTWRALRSGDRRILLVTLPGWFMLAFHAACAVDYARYNLMLVVPFSLAGGIALDAAWTRWARLAAAEPARQAGRS